jgi:hypothetical protein
MHARLCFLVVLLGFGTSWAQPQPGSWNGGGAAVRGGPFIFSDQAAFLAAAGPVITDTFETDSTTSTCDSAGVVKLESSGITAEADMPALKLLEEPCSGNHNTTPNGRKYLGADTDLSGVSAEVTFTFSHSLSAFGLFLIDLDFANLEVTINGVSYPVLQNGDGGQTYFGIVDAAPFNLVTFQIVTAFDAHYSFDDVSYGGVLPSSAGDGLEARSWSGVKARYRE